MNFRCLTYLSNALGVVIEVNRRLTYPRIVLWVVIELKPALDLPEKYSQGGQ